MGIEMFRKQAFQKVEAINKSSWQSEVYLLFIEDDEGVVQTFKVVKSEWGVAFCGVFDESQSEKFAIPRKRSNW